MDDKLQALRRPERVEEAPPPSGESRHKTSRLLLKVAPWTLAAAAILLMYLLFGDRLLPAAKVEVETVVAVPDISGELNQKGSPVASGGSNPFRGTVLFQASGWFEADPFPFRATALASGVVDKVHVLEGQSVVADEPIATLINEDSDLKVQIAKARMEAAQAGLSEANSDHALALARVESMRKQITVADSRRIELADLADRAKDLGPQLTSQENIIQAELRLNTQDQTVDALGAQLKEREIESERLAGQVLVREGLLREAEARLREAELEFERMVIRAPVDGVIQRLMVAPGQKKVLMADNPESATVALLFQPENLQARIDVPIAEASRLSIGQAVLVESEYLPGNELHGHIQRITGEADLQRNTLQVKVRIMDPPVGLRPEILCRAKFLDTSIVPGSEGNSVVQGSSSGRVSSRLSIWVPKNAMFDTRGAVASVWAVDETGRRISKRQLQLTGEERDGYVRILQGLRPGDRVVLNPSSRLKDGKRIDY